MFCFCSKVAAASGDARRALELCRRAAEMAEANDSENDPTLLVTMSHVNTAIQEMYTHPTVTSIR